MNWDIIFSSAIGQLLAIGIVIVGWSIVKTYQFLRTFAIAANQTRVRFVCETKK